MVTYSVQDLLEEGHRQGKAYSRLVTEAYHSFWGSRSWDRDRLSRSRWMLSHAKTVLGISHKWRVLDVGCGIGWTPLEVTRMAPWIGEMVAIDTSVAAIAEAHKLKLRYSPHIQERVRFVFTNFFEHCAEPYHLIYMHAVLEHIPVARAVFDKARQLLHPNGCFMVSTPNHNRLENRLLDFIRRPRKYVDDFHVHEYTVNELKRMAGQDWDLISYSGRTLFDSWMFGPFLLRRFPQAKRKLLNCADSIANCSFNYYLGALFPNLGRELLFFYKKKV
jgi:2-polyprenyl-3-methyl-5-hydroxy-6-metoxy-1,4-benzoquinol methylase